MKNNENTSEHVSNDIKIKINEEIITLMPEIVEKLTMQEKSFFRGAFDFYINENNNEKKPLDLSSAPYVHRFNELPGFLDQNPSYYHTLCYHQRAEEIIELADYLGVLPYNSLDKAAQKARMKNLPKRQNEEALLFDIALIIINTLEEHDYERFTFEFYGDKTLKLFKNSIPHSPIFSFKFLYFNFDTIITKIKHILNPRFNFMLYSPEWIETTKKYGIRVRNLSLEPLQE